MESPLLLTSDAVTVLISQLSFSQFCDVRRATVQCGGQVTGFISYPPPKAVVIHEHDTRISMQVAAVVGRGSVYTSGILLASGGILFIHGCNVCASSTNALVAAKTMPIADAALNVDASLVLHAPGPIYCTMYVDLSDGSQDLVRVDKATPYCRVVSHIQPLISLDLVAPQLVHLPRLRRKPSSSSPLRSSSPSSPDSEAAAAQLESRRETEAAWPGYDTSVYTSSVCAPALFSLGRRRRVGRV